MNTKTRNLNLKELFIQFSPNYNLKEELEELEELKIVKKCLTTMIYK